MRGLDDGEDWQGQGSKCIKGLRQFFEGKGLGCMVMQLGFWDCMMRMEDDGLRMGA